jgi:Pvc16 N-terminal domain
VSEYTVIAEVGEALVRVLWEEIQLDPQVSLLIDNENRISLQSPKELAEDNSVRLSIYLYRVVEDPFLKNQPTTSREGRVHRVAPLALDLCYLVTPLVGTPREQQIVLGKLMQVFYDRALIVGTDLSPGMAEADEEVRIVLNPVSLEETTRVWQALEMSYLLSVCYIVRVALVDSRRRAETTPVVERQGEFAGR